MELRGVLLLLILLLLTMVTTGATSAAVEDDPAWSACWTSFMPPICEAEDVDIPNVGCWNDETCRQSTSNWSLCSIKRPEFRNSVGVKGYARGWASGGFRQIPALPEFVQVLDLSSVNQRHIRKDTFANVPHITGLVIKDADLSFVEKGALSMLTQLTCANLDYNPMPVNIFSEVQLLDQFLLLPSLRRLSARRCHFGFVTTFWQPNNVNLLSLWLSENLMTYINVKSFLNFQSLRDLDLANCDVKVLHFTGASSSLNNLQTFNLSNSRLRNFIPIWNAWNGSLIMLFPNLKVLDLSRNQIPEAELSRPTRFKVDLLPRLEHLNLSHNSIESIPVRSFLPASEFPALKHLDISSQNLKTVYVDDTILQIPSLLSLNLENRLLVFTAPRENVSSIYGFSKRDSKLRELYLGGNCLHGFNEQKVLDLLGHLHDLETLSLANSKLDFVSVSLLSNFPKLRVLVLRGNAIHIIPTGCFDSLTFLSHLDLYDNKITVISQRTFGGLRGRLGFLNLGQNPIECSCDLLWFRDWFMADSKLFSVRDPDYRCHNTPDKTQLAKFILIQQACLLSREVSVGVIIICSFLTITSTAAVLLFRYRWHLRLLLYETFRGRPAVRAAYLQQNRFDYDLFVSYAHEDLAWVRGRLVPELEGRLGLRLCIHDTDFIPGKPILHNIVDSVEKSKKVLMVFSKEFAQSRWCQFELTMCLDHVMHHDDALIIVCVDDVTSHHTMTSTMMAVLTTTTYLQWKEEEGYAVRAFWGRLEQALEEILRRDQQQYV